MTTSMAPKPVQIWRDSVTPRTCRGADCRAKVVFAELCVGGKVMIFDDPLQVLAEESIGLPGLERIALTVDLNANHFASCPNAQEFRRAR